MVTWRILHEMPSPVSSLHQPPTPHTPTAVRTNDTTGEKKPTVLESHGYYLGKAIGSGSYATVRVNTNVNNFFILNSLTNVLIKRLHIVKGMTET